MATFKAVSDAYIASNSFENATLGRIEFWCTLLGEKEIAEVTPDDIDDGLVKLAERGKLAAGRGYRGVPTGEPLAGSTVNRYLGQAASIFKYAKSKRLLKRTFISPTVGVTREAEPIDPQKYLRPEEVARLIAVASVLDKRWGKMRALIVVLFHTGLRIGDVMSVRGEDLDLRAATMSPPGLTKNGEPVVAALSSDAIAELKKLPRVGAKQLVFGAHRTGEAFAYRKLFGEIATEAGLPGRTPHWLRHGHGSLLARSGVSQSMVMHSMGHKSLKAAARYMHANVADKAAVIAKVFG